MSATFHANFKRITAGDNVTAITERTGLDQGSISRYLNGRRVPKLDRLAQIAKAYEVDPGAFFEPLEEAA